ncbi:MAG: asparagine synthase [Rubrivivax sp.]|nr:asparagine synthase [Rubrivivax sp.]
MTSVGCTEVHTGRGLPAIARAPDFDQALVSLEKLLQEAVVHSLANFNRSAAFLSGGIDSTLICALAATASPGLTAITVGFEDLSFDEAPAASRVADYLGVRHAALRFTRDDYLSAFARLARDMEQPMADPATMATLLAFEHCRKHLDVVLDGTGADEAVGAMPPRHVRLAVEYGSRVPAGLRRTLVRAMSRVPGLAGYTPILDFEHPAETLMRWKGFTRPEIEELCGEPVSLEGTTFYRTFARFPRHAHFERYTALLNAMPCDRLTQAMKLTGLRVRFPFCAPDVGGFLRQLPTEWRHLPGQPKRILRELLARYVPRELWDGPKRGFTFPLHDFLAGDGYALVHQHVLAGRWLGRGLMRPEVVRRYAQAYIGGDRRLMFRVWALVVLGAWLDAHEDLTIPPPGA